MQREKLWSTIPKKERNEFPEFLPKISDELALKRTMRETGKMEKLQQSGFDGNQNYPKYTYETRYKNLNGVKHLMHPGSFMSTVQWETSLR